LVGCCRRVASVSWDEADVPKGAFKRQILSGPDVQRLSDQQDEKQKVGRDLPGTFWAAAPSKATQAMSRESRHRAVRRPIAGVLGGDVLIAMLRRGVGDRITEESRRIQ